MKQELKRTELQIKDADKKQIIHRPGVFITGETLDLRRLTEDDALNSGWHDWFNDEMTTKNLQKHYYPNSPTLQLEFFRRMEADRSTVQLGIIPKDLDKLVGVVSLTNIDFINSNSEFSMVLGDKEYRSQGFCVEAFDLILKHAFLTMNLHKIHSGALNHRFYEMLCKTFGFHSEGVWQQHAYKDGRYLDIYRLGLFRDDFFEALERRQQAE